jgi:hypothetical protein
MDATGAAWSVDAFDARGARPDDMVDAFEARGARPDDMVDAFEAREARPDNMIDACEAMPNDTGEACAANEMANEAAGDEGGDGACTPFGACADDCHHASGVVSGEVEVPVAVVVAAGEERRAAGIPTRVSSAPWQPPRGVILF